MAVDQLSPVSHDARRRAVAIGPALLVIVGLSVLWMATRPTTVPASTSASFLGVVTNTPATEGIICVHPDPGEPSGITDGGDYCAKAYPSRGLTVETIHQGDRVRLVTFVTADKSGEDVSGALVLPAALGQPPAA